MAKFPVVDLTSTDELGGLSHDEKIRAIAAMCAAAAAGANGADGYTVAYRAKRVEDYIRNGFQDG